MANRGHSVGSPESSPPMQARHGSRLDALGSSRLLHDPRMWRDISVSDDSREFGLRASSE